MAFGAKEDLTPNNFCVSITAFGESVKPRRFVIAGVYNVEDLINAVMRSYTTGEAVLALELEGLGRQSVVLDSCGGRQPNLTFTCTILGVKYMGRVNLNIKTGTLEEIPAAR